MERHRPPSPLYSLSPVQLDFSSLTLAVSAAPPVDILIRLDFNLALIVRSVDFPLRNHLPAVSARLVDFLLLLREFVRFVRSVDLLISAVQFRVKIVFPALSPPRSVQLNA